MENSSDGHEIIQFDFTSHKRKAIEAYTKVRPQYERYANILKDLIFKCLQHADIKYHSIEARAKSIESFGEKASKPSDDNSNEPQYKNAIEEITDKAGVRIIAFFPKNIEEIDNLLSREFFVIEKSNKNDLLEKEEKFGYQSVHYLVKLPESRENLPEYSDYKGLISEIQVRTILQHAWAEIEHDIEYKNSVVIPKSIKRRFLILAGLIELADREFQSIQNENEDLKKHSRRLVNSGILDEIEITGDSLKAYLDKKFGPDGRLVKFSYDYEARILIKIGFKNLHQIDECIKPYNADNISRILFGSRMGQLSRLEFVITAGLGKEIIVRHPYTAKGDSWWIKIINDRLSLLENSGIKTGTFTLPNL
jgi:ppGpp synthetase/RelA/SpoT-type nucleotidyltranferase